jgi:hypothetical protein
MATNEHIVNNTNRLGDYIFYWTAIIDGKRHYIFEAKSANFIEETP